MPGELRFDSGANDCHDTATKDTPESGGKLQWSLSVRGVRALFLGDPDAEVDAGAEDAADVLERFIRRVEGLTNEVRDKGSPMVVYLIWPIIHTRGRAST